jgi:hypothetical protein
MDPNSDIRDSYLCLRLLPVFPKYNVLLLHSINLLTYS